MITSISSETFRIINQILQQNKRDIRAKAIKWGKKENRFLIQRHIDKLYLKRIFTINKEKI